jgi:cell division septation protein DedD
LSVGIPNREGRAPGRRFPRNPKRIDMLDRAMIALTVVLVAVITGVMAFAPPPSDPSKPWIVRSWLFPNRAPSAHPSAAPEQAATPVTPAPSPAPSGGTGSGKVVVAQPPSPEAGSSPRTPIVLVSPPTPVGPVAATPTRYTVQVGALRDQANADLLVEQLRAHGFTPVVSKDSLYRVRVGESLDRTAADQLAATLQAAGFDTYVRSY